MKLTRGLGRGPAAMAVCCLLMNGCIVGIIDLDDDGPWDKEASTVVTRSVPLSTQDGLHVTGLNGTVVVTGIPGLDEITVRATKTVSSSSIVDAEAHLSSIHVSVHTSAHTVFVETDQPSQAGNRSYRVDYEITLPEDLFLSIVNANGNVRAEGMRWEFEAEVANGNVEIVDGHGSAWVTIGNGTLIADLFLPDGGEIVFSVGNGSALLDVQPEVSAEFSAQVGNGTIVISGLTIQDQTSAPNVFRGTLGDGAGSIDVTVGNGTIRVNGG